MLAPNRKQVVGLLTEDPNIVLEEGAQIVAAADAPKGAHAIGHVTSSYLSPTLNRSIALALVEDGRARKDGRVFALDAKGAIAATVSDTVFYDKKGARLDV